MADTKKIATRESYGQTLVDLANEGCDDLVVLDADLSASTKTALFRAAYPERHFNCGIAEANMMAVAAGLSTCGYVPFVSSFAMFATGRAYEQIRNSIGYPHLNVKIAASHAGLAVGEDGASHQCCEDIALMRSIPGMLVLCPADDVETRAAVRAAYAYDGPVYLRLARQATLAFYTPESCHFAIGRGDTLIPGNDVAIVATGTMVAEAIRAAGILKRNNIGARVINMSTVKPLDNELLLRCAAECKRIITVEEHSIIGGLGEAVCAYLSERLPTPVRRIGVRDVYGHSASAQQVLIDFGLTAENIAATAQEMLRTYPIL